MRERTCSVLVAVLVVAMGDAGALGATTGDRCPSSR